VVCHFAIRELALATTKFEVFLYLYATYYKDMKSDTKCGKYGK